jgi:hypothetical protein
MYKKDDLNLAALYQKNFLKEHQFPMIVVDTKDEDDYTSGASDMAKDQLEFIIKSATHILANLNNGETFEPWVASKITLANDYLSTVAQVIGGEEMDEEDEEEEINGGGLVTPDTCRATGDGTMA